MENLQHLHKVKNILNAFEDSEFTVYEFLHGLLSTNIFEDHPVTLSIIEDLDSILDMMKSAVSTSDQTEQWMFRNAEKGYQAQVLRLTEKESGSHSQANKITDAQLTETKIEKISRQMDHYAPDLWRLIANLLAADPATSRRRVQMCRNASSWSNDGDITMGDAAGDGEEEVPGTTSSGIQLIDDDDDAPEDLTEQAQQQFNTLIVIVSDFDL
jgi:hypothetical protein